MKNLFNLINSTLLLLVIILSTVLFISIDSNIPTYVIYLLIIIDFFAMLSLAIEFNSERLNFYITKKRCEKVSNYLNKKGYRNYIDKANFLMLECDNLTSEKQNAIRLLCYFNNIDFDTYYKD